MKQMNQRLSQSTDLPPRPLPLKADLGRPVASEAASLLYSHDEGLCFCRECRLARHEFTLSDSGDEHEHLPSFRASPKFQDAPTDSLTEFLKANGLISLLPILQEHEVTLSELFLLTREDFAEMKIPIGPRNRLLSVLQKGQSVSLSQSKLDLPRIDPELDSPKQHSIPSVKPATPEKPPLHSLNSSEAETPVQLHRRQLNEEVESFLQEVDELFSRSQRKKESGPVLKQAEAVPQQLPQSVSPQVPQPSGALSSQQMDLLKSLLSDKETIEKGLESLQKSISELKENRDSRGTSPVPRQESSRSSPPKTKLPLNMKKGLSNRLK